MTLEELFNVFHKGYVSCIAGGQRMGKTALILTYAFHAALEYGEKIVLVEDQYDRLLRISGFSESEIGKLFYRIERKTGKYGFRSMMKHISNDYENCIVLIDYDDSFYYREPEESDLLELKDIAVKNSLSVVFTKNVSSLIYVTDSHGWPLLRNLSPDCFIRPTPEQLRAKTGTPILDYTDNLVVVSRYISDTFTHLIYGTGQESFNAELILMKNSHGDTGIVNALLDPDTLEFKQGSL